MTPAPIYLARAGQHECYDRVLFDINGPADAGYTTKYVPVVRADASGAPVPVEGRAALQISVRDPSTAPTARIISRASAASCWRKRHCTRHGRRMGLPH
jgi:hypothetical protein